MDTANSTSPPKPDQTNLQTPVSPAPVAQPVFNETKPKKSGQISVNKAFIIIYVLVLVFILAGPEFIHDNAGNVLDQLGFLFNGGFLLIIFVVMLHIFFLWREKKKNR